MFLRLRKVWNVKQGQGVECEAGASCKPLSVIIFLYDHPHLCQAGIHTSVRDPHLCQDAIITDLVDLGLTLTPRHLALSGCRCGLAGVGGP